jgi:hypothetical protein
LVAADPGAKVDGHSGLKLRRLYDRHAARPRRLLLSSNHLRPSYPRSLHRPVAPTDGSLIENFNKTGVRLWTDRPVHAAGKSGYEDAGLSSNHVDWGSSSLRRLGGLIESDPPKNRVPIRQASGAAEPRLAHASQQPIVGYGWQCLPAVQHVCEDAPWTPGEVDEFQLPSWLQHASNLGEHLPLHVMRQVMKHHRREHAVEARVGER